MANRKIEGLLARVFHISGLSPEGRLRIGSEARMISAARGEVLVKAGEACAGIYAVLKGHVSLLAESANGARKVLAIMGAGETFGEASMFLDKPWMTDAVAAEPSTLLFLAKAPILAEIDVNPRFARHMLGALSRQVERHALDARTNAMSGLQRVAALLLAQIGPNLGDRSVTLVLPASKHEIASRLDLTPEHLSRMLRTLSECGAIQVHGLEVTIRSARALRDIIARSRVEHDVGCA